MLKFYCLIAIGSASGACARFFLSKHIGTLTCGFPLSTFIVNVSGCFLIGFLIHYFSYKLTIPLFLQAGLTIGFLGGFTTFSAFALEILLLLEKKQWLIGLTYFILSNSCSILSVYFGILCGRRIY